MKHMRFVLFVIALGTYQCTFAQKTLKQLQTNRNFQWEIDTSARLDVYYLKNSWASRNLMTIRKRVYANVDSVKSFMGIDEYNSKINLFAVDSRTQMKLLVGHETNGSAIYKANAFAGIATQATNSIFSIHELFHVIAMKNGAYLRIG